MRVLFVAVVAHSHVTAMVPLAWALRAEGHDVRVACDGNARPGVLAAGLSAVPIGGDATFEREHRSHVRGVPGGRYYRREDALTTMFADVTEATLGDLLRLAGLWRPDVIVRDPVAFAADITGAALGVPVVRQVWGPDVFGTEQGQWLSSMLADRLGPHYAAVGASPADPHRQVVIDPCPAAMQQLGPGVAAPVRYVSTDFPGVAPDWALAPAGPRPRVVVTWGTFSGGLPGATAATRVVSALAGLGADVVAMLSADDAAAIGTPPTNTRVVTGVPLHVLLPSCTAMVCHGGANSVLGGLLHGVPQLVISELFERALTGDRLAASGAGLHLPAASATEDTIIGAVAELLGSPRFAARAGELQADMLARPSPGELARGFAELAGTRDVVPGRPEEASGVARSQVTDEP